MADIDVRTDSWRKHSTKVYRDGLTVTQGATAYTSALSDHAFGSSVRLFFLPMRLLRRSLPKRIVRRELPCKEEPSLWIWRQPTLS